MTDTEAKALALVNEVFMERCLNLATYTNRVKNVYHEVICRAIERLEATEARHAAELREQAERFEAFRQELSEICRHLPNRPFVLDRFILTKPDPLVEVLNEAWDEVGRPAQANRLRAGLAARGYEVRKIGEG